MYELSELLERLNGFVFDVGSFGWVGEGTEVWVSVIGALGFDDSLVIIVFFLIFVFKSPGASVQRPADLGARLY